MEIALVVRIGVINTLVPLNGKTSTSIPDELLVLMNEHNFDPKQLQKALESLK